MKTIEVELGGSVYTLRPLPIKKAREWRKQLREPFNRIIGTLDQLTGADKVEITDFESLKRLVAPLAEMVLDSVDVLLELLFAYAPELKADRKRIEDNATDEEALAALVEVVKLAYPFSSILSTFQNGRVLTAMKKSSPAPSGELTGQN